MLLRCAPALLLPCRGQAQAGRALPAPASLLQPRNAAEMLPHADAHAVPRSVVPATSSPSPAPAVVRVLLLLLPRPRPRWPLPSHAAAAVPVPPRHLRLHALLNLLQHGLHVSHRSLLGGWKGRAHSFSHGFV